MKYLPVLAIATLLNVTVPLCFAQATAATTTTTTASKNDSTTQAAKQDKKAAKAKKNKPAGKMTTTPSQEAAYALTNPKGIATQSPPPK
jgi:hypothetical protein